MADRPFYAKPIPSSDRAFNDIVNRLASDAASPNDLLARLHALYPRAALKERGLSNEPRVFYVYRDGHFESGTKEPWWLDADVARVTLSAATGRLTDVNNGWSQLIGAPAAALVGRHYTDFILPEAMPAIMVLFETLVATGHLHSEALLRREDGSRVAIEFHATSAGDAIDIAYRVKGA